MEQNVLIGTVKSRRQLMANLNERFYHIPEAVVPESMLPVEYIALYLPESVFGKNEEGCIKYYGKVSGIKTVKRSEIKSLPSNNGDISYYVFNVECWNRLPNVIERKYGGVYTKAFTSLEKLLSAKDLSEIIDTRAIVRKAEKRRLALAFSKEQINNIYISEEPVGVRQFTGRINAAGERKIVPQQITKFLLKEEYLTVRDDGHGKEYRSATAKGEELGIMSDWVQTPDFKGYCKNYYDENAQEFIVEHLNEIVMINVSEANRNK